LDLPRRRDFEIAVLARGASAFSHMPSPQTNFSLFP